MSDIGAVGREIALSVREYVQKASEPLMARIVELEGLLKSLPAGPKGDTGATGNDGAPGRDGANGRDGVDGVQGKDGESIKGDPGHDGAPGRDGAEGPIGKSGENGKSVTVEDIRPILEGEVAKWALDFERRATDILQRSVDRLPVPKDGKDGADGFGLDDFSVGLKEDGRTFVFRFARGDVVKEIDVRTAMLLDAGIFSSEKAYVAGDTLTFGGSLWIAQKDAPQQPPGISDDWRLAAKRGRDGKDGMLVAPPKSAPVRLA